MYHETRSYVVPLTRDLAHEWATTLAWPGDRVLNNSRLGFLRREFDEGRFYSPEWAKAWLKGKAYRVNGKHSAIMLSGLNGAFPNNLQAHITEFECQDEGDVVDLFSTFDPAQSARRGPDYARALMSTKEGLLESGVRPNAAYNLASGICVWANDGKRMKMGQRERATYINEDPTFIAEAGPYASRPRCPVGICAAMYATWRANRSTWAAFWDAVFSESDPDPQSPSRKLARYVRENPRSASEAATREVCGKAIHAWNAYMGNGHTLLSYRANKPLPIPRGQ